MGTVTTLPTAPTSYINVRKSGIRWVIELATAAGSKTLRTALGRSASYEAAAAAAEIGAQRQRPVRLPRGQ